MHKIEKNKLRIREKNDLKIQALRQLEIYCISETQFIRQCQLMVTSSRKKKRMSRELTNQLLLLRWDLLLFQEFLVPNLLSENFLHLGYTSAILG